MLQLRKLGLAAKSWIYLNNLQKEINEEPTFKDKVIKAKSSYHNASRTRNFEVIKEALAKMCKGNQRCCYCEDAAGSTIEHIYPKKLYPNKTFKWENLCYICGDCNSHKTDTFLVFTKGNNYQTCTEKELIKGKAVYLNPRKDNPLSFLILDLITFQFIANINDETSISFVRAKKTIEDFKLNVRGINGDVLTNQRKIAFKNYFRWLKEYHKEKQLGNISKLEELKNELIHHSHPTVWQEIKRYYKEYPDSLQENYPSLYSMLVKCPELTK